MSSAAILIEIEEGMETDYTIFNNILYSDEGATMSVEWGDFDSIATVVGNDISQIINIPGVGWVGSMELKSGMGLSVYTNYEQVYIKFDI